jgi:hypothetical protein
MGRGIRFHLNGNYLWGGAYDYHHLIATICGVKTPKIVFDSTPHELKLVAIELVVSCGVKIPKVVFDSIPRELKLVAIELGVPTISPCRLISLKTISAPKVNLKVHRKLNSLLIFI